LLLKPRSADEVKKILTYCFEKNLAVTVQGGNTSMVGGAIPIFDEIILNTSLMNEIDDVDEVSGTINLSSLSYRFLLIDYGREINQFLACFREIFMSMHRS
jgi:hypothetical protein